MQWNKETIFAAVKKYQYVLLVLLVGILLLAWPSGEESTSQTTTDTDEDSVVFDLPALEEELAQILSQIEGVGEADVVLTLSDGGKKVLATDESIGETSQETTTVIISNGSSQQSTVTVELIYPTFQGALIVCDGGNSSTVRLAVVQAVGALTGLKSSQISVCARSGGS